MTWQAWLTLAVTAGVVFILAKDYIAPWATMLGAVVLLLVAGVISPAEAFAGFSNAAPITVAALFVLARAADKTNALAPILAATLGDANQGRRRLLARLMFPSAALSAFLNNTPIVAMLTPQVAQWAERRGQSPSRYLMPLSFAVILGGVITVIGTSTNLVVSGLMEEAGHPGIGMFELAKVGLPVAIAGIVIMLFTAPALLPDRRPAAAQLSSNVREFVVHMRVVAGGPLDGRSVAEGGLRHLQGVYLAELERGAELIAPVTPATVLHGGDLLTFIGRADLIVDLTAQRGLASAEEKHVERFGDARHTFFEAVVGASSSLVGRTLKDSDFRNRYQAAVVAIHRSGERVKGKLGEIDLQLGDTLLLLSDPGFSKRWRHTGDFLLVSRLGGSPPAASRKAPLVGLITLAIVVVAGAGLLPILQASLIGAIVLVMSGVLTATEARESVDLDTILLIAASFGLGNAMQESGLAQTLAAGLVGAFESFGPQGVLFGIVLATIILIEVITHNAAAALMFPIGMATAAQMGINYRSFAIAIAVAASLSFLTPIGYATNVMVYGPGGYKFSDYARLGTPLTILTIIVVMLVVPVAWPF